MSRVDLRKNGLAHRTVPDGGLTWWCWKCEGEGVPIDGGAFVVTLDDAKAQFAGHREMDRHRSTIALRDEQSLTREHRGPSGERLARRRL